MITAEEKLDEIFLTSNFAEYPHNDTFDVTIKAMKEFAELKCKELLEIVAEKVETRVIQTNYDVNNGGFDFSVYEINKASILNAVDLKGFINEK